MNLSLLNDLHWYEMRKESINEKDSQRNEMNDRFNYLNLAGFRIAFDLENSVFYAEIEYPIQI